MREDLELEKLKLEIKRLNYPWWKNLEFWKVAFPTVAVIASLYFTFGKGIIDSEKVKLEIQKEQLKLDITRFEMKKDELSKTIVSKDSIKNNLQKQIHIYESYKKTLLNRIQVLNKGLNLSQKEIKNLNTKNLNDQKFYESKLSYEYNNEKNRLSELNNLEQKINTKNIEISEKDAELKFLNSKIELTKEEKLDLSLIKNDASIKATQQNINQYNNQIKKLKEDYDRELKRIDNMSPDDLFKEFQLQIIKSSVEEK